jgi:hypothetical protein
MITVVIIMKVLLFYCSIYLSSTEANGRCFNEVRLFFKLDVTDAGYRVKKMLFGGSFDMDEKDYGTRNSDYNSDDNSKNGSSNGHENDTSKYNDNNRNRGNEEHLKKVLREKGRGARLTMQHDDLTSKESLSLARFICAQVYMYECVLSDIYTFIFT